MEMLPAVFASGWASGINAWATVLVLGVLGRFAEVDGIPAGFQRTDVLIIVAVLCVVEVIADKIPLLDSLWDGAATFVRPAAGAIIGAAWAGEAGVPAAIAMATVGGITALGSHLVKAGLRLAVNTSPEPFTNVAASAAGDVAVTGMATMIALAPVAAAVIAALALAAGFWVLRAIALRIDAGRARLRSWRAARRGSAPGR